MIRRPDEPGRGSVRPDSLVSSPLSEPVPLDVLNVLARSFSGTTVAQWRALTGHELRAGRLSPQNSRLVECRSTSATLAVCLAVETEGGARIGPTAVAPEARGRGIGAAVLDAVLAGLAGMGPGTTLEVARDNEAAIRLYASRGFDRRRPLCTLGAPATPVRDLVRRAVRIERRRALDVRAALPQAVRPSPTFLRASHVLPTYAPVEGWAALDGSRLLGLGLRSGGEVLDLASMTSDGAGVASLAVHLARCGAHRMLHVVESDPVVPILRASGWTMVGRAWELFRPNC